MTWQGYGTPTVTKTGCVDGPITTDGTFTLPCSVTTNAAPILTSGAVSETVKVDLTDPSSSAVVSPAEQNGWYASPVVTLTGDDGTGSGVASIQYRIDGEATWHLYTAPLGGFSTGSHFVQFFATDNAGRVESAVNLVAFKADATTPTVNIANPVDGESVPLGKTQKATYKCADKDSGVASCVGPVASGSPIDTSTIGTRAFTVTGTDKAGNVTTVTIHYTVVYTWNGFVQPVSNEADGVLNLVHAGDLVKLKFGLGSATSLDVLGRGSPASVPVACPAWTPHTVGASPGTPLGLSYGVASPNYAFGWQTDVGWAGTCRRFQLQLNDGTPPHTAVFMFFA